MAKKVKKHVAVSVLFSFALLVGTFGILFANGLDPLSFATSVFQTGTPEPFEGVVVEEKITGSRVDPLYAGDRVVKGIFDSFYRDVYVYVYVNDDFVAFRQIKSGNQFEVAIKNPLKAGDFVYVDLGAYNSGKTLSSSIVTVRGERGEDVSLVKEVGKIMSIGSFDFEKALVSGDQNIKGKFPRKHKNAFVYVYVNGKYYGGRQFASGNKFNVNLRNPLKVGDHIEMKLYSYNTKVLLEGDAFIVE